MSGTKPQADQKNGSFLKSTRTRAISNEASDSSVLTPLSDSDNIRTNSEPGTIRPFVTAGIEAHIADALEGVSALRREIKTLKRRNTELQDQLDVLHESPAVSIQPKRGKRSNVSVQALNAQVKKLNNEVAKLAKTRKKDKKRIKELETREIVKDALELKTEEENGVDDSYDNMRKLLRRFFRLMTAPSLEEKEECIICWEAMSMESVRSLPCQHVLCAKCLSNLEKQECPTCRASIEDIHDAERVEMTATQQWDALLEIAAEWARIDRHGGDDEPEDTEEESTPFIDDEGSDASSSAPRPLPGENKHKEMEEDNPSPDPPSSPARIRKRAQSTPPPQAGPSSVPQEMVIETPETPSRPAEALLSYQRSPTTVKRRRLEELANARKQKRKW